MAWVLPPGHPARCTEFPVGQHLLSYTVLGGADSDEPLMLPLEAIEPDAFRRRHEHDTFWCGLLLGGCGLELTTKLYTDRLCSLSSAAC